MDCLLEEIKILKKFKREHPSVHKYDDPPHHKKKESKKSGFGKFTFHGGFKSKEDAKKKEKEVGGFIKEKNGRYYVMKEK